MRKCQRTECESRTREGKGDKRCLGEVAHVGLLLVVGRAVNLVAALHERALVCVGVGVLSVGVEELFADLARRDGGRVLAVEHVDCGRKDSM